MALANSITTRLNSLCLPILVIAVCCWPTFSLADDATIAVPLVPSQVAVKGTFTQRKNIKPLKRPFTSSGNFIYYPNKGLLWHTQEPLEAMKLFAQNGVYSINQQGEKHKEATLDNEFFLALFSADEQKLATFFTTKTQISNDDKHAQCLALTPKSELLTSLFTQINLCTKHSEKTEQIPSEIELIEENGNNTHIVLQLLDTQISAVELAYFD